MTALEMSERIVAVVRDTDHASFTEIMEACGPEAKGDRPLELKENLVLWEGVSVAFDDAFRLALRQIELHTTSVLTYMYDGAGLRLPIAKRVQPYKNPHWLPVAFRLKNAA